MKNLNSSLICLGFILTLFGATSCSSGPEVKQQQFAKLRDRRTYEYSFPIVWKGIETALHGYVITDRNPNKVDDNEMRKLRHRTLDTYWVYSRSTEKYQTYRVNDFPKKIYLQTRSRYHVDAKAVMGGVDVSIDPQQEVERLNADGSSAGYDKLSEPERAQSAGILDKIDQAILSAAP